MAKYAGTLPLINPKLNHKNVPIVNNKYIDNEMPLVFFVCMVFMACGRKERVVQNTTNKPVIMVIVLYYFTSYYLDGYHKFDNIPRITQVCVLKNYRPEACHFASNQTFALLSASAL